jgi:hypothetical protein
MTFLPLFSAALVALFQMVSAATLENCIPGYTAAVYAHRPFLFENVLVSRQQAVANMMRNVDVYKTQAEDAARQVQFFVHFIF